MLTLALKPVKMEICLLVIEVGKENEPVTALKAAGMPVPLPFALSKFG
jgi:hypothetical protein